MLSNADFRVTDFCIGERQAFHKGPTKMTALVCEAEGGHFLFLIFLSTQVPVLAATGLPQ